MKLAAYKSYLDSFKEKKLATPQDWTVSIDILMALCDECKFA